MHSDVFRLRLVFLLTLLHSPAVGKVGKPRWGHPLVEFMIVGKIRRKRKTLPQVDSTLVHARAFTHALKGRPREMRTVKPLFRLPRGSSARCIREPEESLNACLLDRGVSRQRIIGHTDVSAANPHLLRF